jgi:hypothetical protein
MFKQKSIMAITIKVYTHPYKYANFEFSANRMAIEVFVEKQLYCHGQNACGGEKTGIKRIGSPN